MVSWVFFPVCQGAYHFGSPVLSSELLPYLNNRDNPGHILVWFNKNPHLTSAWPNICSSTHSFGNCMTSLNIVPSSSSLLTMNTWNRNPTPPRRWEKPFLPLKWIWPSDCSSHDPKFPKLFCINCYSNGSTLGKKKSFHFHLIELSSTSPLEWKRKCTRLRFQGENSSNVKLHKPNPFL